MSGLESLTLEPLYEFAPALPGAYRCIPVFRLTCAVSPCVATIFFLLRASASWPDCSTVAVRKVLGYQFVHWPN
jgi:hypothetical protein